MHVVVVGAGLSGLNAAAKLTAHGMRVTVIEATSRIGGRVRSEEIVPGIVVDLGAQWVSRHHRRVIALAEAAEARLIPSTYQEAILYEEPEPPLPARLDAYRLVGLLRAGMRHPSARNDGILLADWLRRKAWSNESAAWLTQRLSSDLCADADRVSVMEVQRQFASIGGLRALMEAEDFVVEGGASRLLRYLGGSSGADILLDRPVTRVSQREDGVTVECRGQEIDCDRVILAIPPTLLKDILFSPTLPDRRREVLAQFVPGRVVKTIALFDRPWWRSRQAIGRTSAKADFSGIVDGGAGANGAALMIGLSTADRAYAVSRFDPSLRGARMAWVVAEAMGSSAREPVSVRSLDWNAEPYGGGGYAARRGAEGWRLAGDLFEPFGRIVFAGTEAATDWRSYMEGALQAGERAATVVLGEAGAV